LAISKFSKFVKLLHFASDVNVNTRHNEDRAATFILPWIQQTLLTVAKVETPYSCLVMTSLQKQLAVIAASSTQQLDLKAQKVAHGKSLLFEPKVAASQSFENLYLICYEGYRDLCALDRRFLQFSRSLFSEQSKVEDRTQMTKKENEKLDGVLESFMSMVGPRLLLKPAEKALEWLVRRFRYVTSRVSPNGC
jgi:hypothetical protein